MNVWSAVCMAITAVIKNAEWCFDRCQSRKGVIFVVRDIYCCMCLRNCITAKNINTSVVIVTLSVQLTMCFYSL